MSHLEDLRSTYELHDCPDHEIIDRVLDAVSLEYRVEEEAHTLTKGRQVHRISLTNETPATVVRAEINVKLESDVSLYKYNHLESTDFDSPGSWFVRKGFTVRSTKENGCWIQYAFNSSGPTNLTRTEIMEYLDCSGLDYDPSQI